MAVLLEDVQADNTLAVSSISMQSVILLLLSLVPSIRYLYHSFNHTSSLSEDTKRR